MLLLYVFCIPFLYIKSLGSSVFFVVSANTVPNYFTYRNRHMSESGIDIVGDSEIRFLAILSLSLLRQVFESGLN
jgi:hypothetical protein